MQTTSASTTVNEAFYPPLRQALPSAEHLWFCPELPDDEWARTGVERVLEASPGGRAFLQEHGPRFEKAPATRNYFAALRSVRRLDLIRELARNVVGQIEPRLTDRLADIPELDGYACFAGDGHWHRGAIHDPRREGTKMAAGHFYRLNLRAHTLARLTPGEGLHEHDMSALKRVRPKGLRQGVPRGTSPAAREAQAQLIALTHNLLLTYEQELEDRHEVSNGPEDRRRAQRSEALRRRRAREGTPVSRLLMLARRATQRGVKFIRRLRQSLRDRLAEALAVARLKALYARL